MGAEILFYDDFEYDNIQEHYSFSGNIDNHKKYLNTSVNAAFSDTKGLLIEATFPSPGEQIAREIGLLYESAKFFSVYTFMLSNFRWEFQIILTDNQGREFSLEYGHAGAQWIGEWTYNVGVYYSYLDWRRIHRNIEDDLKSAFDHPDSPEEVFKPVYVQAYALMADVGYNGGCFDNIVFSNKLIPRSIQSTNSKCGNYTVRNPTIENIGIPTVPESSSDTLLNHEHYPYLFGGILLFIYLIYYTRKRRFYSLKRSKRPELYPEIKD
jgi:hypothetical protein